MKNLILKFIDNSFELSDSELDIFIIDITTKKQVNVAEIFQEIGDTLGFSAMESAPIITEWVEAKFIEVNNSVVDKLYQLHKELFDGKPIDRSEINKANQKLTPKYTEYLELRFKVYIQTINEMAKIIEVGEIKPSFFREY